jgi:hypothetical protein
MQTCLVSFFGGSAANAVWDKRPATIKSVVNSFFIFSPYNSGCGG